ncbi:MAG: MBL fold metallo-hydrolase [Elusimicrobiota bacterium]
MIKKYGFLSLFSLFSACAQVPSSIVSDRLLSPPPAPKDIPPASRTFALELINRRRTADISLEVFVTGRVRTRGEVVSSLKSWHSKVALDVPAFLIRNPKEGLILFDTGLSSQTPRKANLLMSLVDPAALQYEASAGQDLLSQLYENGVDPKEIRWILLSHLHEDHAGMVSAMPQAGVMVSREEWDRWKERWVQKGGGPPAWAQDIEKRLKLVDFDSKPAFGPMIHAEDAFGDGSVYLTDLPGHTPGNMGALVALEGGPVLLTGDAAMVVDNYLDLALPLKPRIEDLGQYWRSLHIIRALSDSIPRLVVVPGHDLITLRIAQRPDIPIHEGKARKGRSRRKKSP